MGRISMAAAGGGGRSSAIGVWVIAVLLTVASVTALPVIDVDTDEPIQYYIPGGAEEEATIDNLRDRQSQIALDLARTRSAAPADVLEQDSPQLGESDKRVASATDMNGSLAAGLKIWKEGEKKNGDESFKKLNAAISKAEDGALKKAWSKGEHMLEQAAIHGHVKHPREFAKEGAGAMKKGMGMATKFAGDDITNVEGTTEGQKEDGQGDDYGKEVVEDFKKSDKLVHLAKEAHAKSVMNAPKRAEARKQKMAQLMRDKAKKATAAAVLALAKAKNDKNPKMKKKDTKLANEINHDAKQATLVAKRLAAVARKAKSSAASKAVHPQKETPSQRLSFLQLRASKVPTDFHLPPQAEPSIRPLVMADAAKMIARKAKEDAATEAAMREAEAKIHAELAPLHRTTKNNRDKKVKNNADVKKETKFLQGLHVPPQSLVEMGTSAAREVPPGFMLPSAPVASVQKDVQGDVKKAMAMQAQIEAQEQASVRKVEKDNFQRFAPLESKSMSDYRQERQLDQKLAKVAQKAERRSVKAGAHAETGRMHRIPKP